MSILNLRNEDQKGKPTATVYKPGGRSILNLSAEEDEEQKKKRLEAEAKQPKVYSADFIGPIPAGSFQQKRLWQLPDGRIVNDAQYQSEIDLQTKPQPKQKESLGKIIKAQFDVTDPSGFAGGVKEMAQG